MRIASRLAVGIGAFVLGAGLVLWFTARERTGTTGATMLVILAIGFFYIAFVTRRAAGGAEDVTSAEQPSALEEKAEEEEEEEAIAPTIWPLGFSLAAAGLILGVVVQRWLLIPGAVIFLASGLGWFNDIRRQHRSTRREAHRP